MPEDAMTIVLAELRELRQSVDSRLDKLETRLDKLETRLDAVEARLDRLETGLAEVKEQLDQATGGGKVTLALIVKQQAQILQEQQVARANQRVTETMLGRLDASMQGLTAEMRALREQQQLQTEQWRNHEARLTQVEEHVLA